MGFIEVLTIVFVILKATGNLDWPWIIVFAPEMAAVVLYIVLIILQIAAAKSAEKRRKKRIREILSGRIK